MPIHKNHPTTVRRSKVSPLQFKLQCIFFKWITKSVLFFFTIKQHKNLFVNDKPFLYTFCAHIGLLARYGDDKKMY